MSPQTCTAADLRAGDWILDLRDPADGRQLTGRVTLVAREVLYPVFDRVVVRLYADNGTQAREIHLAPTAPVVREAAGV